MVLLCGCAKSVTSQQEVRTPSREESVDGALAKAAGYLVNAQSPDGSWRSDHYAQFKDGDLTPLVLLAISRAPASEKLDLARTKALDFLVKIGKDEKLMDTEGKGLNYPVYAASLAVVALSSPGLEKHRATRDVWLTYLKKRQLTEELGWEPGDRYYGGWGYSLHLPRKPKPNEFIPPTESNLSATVFALDALKAAGCPADDPAFKKALAFVERCQNFNDSGKTEEGFDDGGFFFILDDAARNKAGPAGKDKQGRERYLSYGSATADGLRALRRCGLADNHPRVQAARNWLEKNFRADIHPGNYLSVREPLRATVYYYYTWSVAQTLRDLGVDEVNTASGKVRWAEALADELVKRQKADGSWVNPADAQREDDPMVATGAAAAALSICRDVTKKSK